MVENTHISLRPHENYLSRSHGPLYERCARISRPATEVISIPSIWYIVIDKYYHRRIYLYNNNCTAAKKTNQHIYRTFPELHA